MKHRRNSEFIQDKIEELQKDLRLLLDKHKENLETTDLITYSMISIIESAYNFGSLESQVLKMIKIGLDQGKYEYYESRKNVKILPLGKS